MGQRRAASVVGTGFSKNGRSKTEWKIVEHRVLTFIAVAFRQRLKTQNTFGFSRTDCWAKAHVILETGSVA
jgi:hypothetical protein